MRGRRSGVPSLILGCLILPFLVTVAPRNVQAGVVERVVAVVGRDAVLLSELRKRARPVLLQIYERFPAGPQRSAVESEMYKELLQQMVDEKLIQLAADRAQKRITSEEVDNGMRNLAAMQGLSQDDLIKAAKNSGISEAELRAQVARQVLEQKMLSLRVMPRIRISSEDVKIGYQKLRREERRQLGFRLQWLVLVVPPGSSDEAKAERRQLAERIVDQARAGADFAQLVATYSDDGETRNKGGDLGPLKPGRLAQPLEDAAMNLEVGEISPPIFHSNAYVILRVVERDASRLPPLDQAHDRIASEVYTERLQKARRQWLEELKRSTYVDVRL
ncbi:MAG: peptidylprolyl isomerase [Myxococcales bacterium]|nr:peptidylprolyl isomerase [Polyangiaceae bacterium]MDW8249956.1 peptidylprolyl isomerase [Myxococcales bacterium]